MVDATTPSKVGDDLPHDLAHRLDHELMDVVTLLHTALRQHERIGAADEEADGDNMTDASSRVASLVRMADDKVRGVIRSMSPYV